MDGRQGLPLPLPLPNRGENKDFKARSKNLKEFERYLKDI
jgi:hypothetical protein